MKKPPKPIIFGIINHRQAGNTLPRQGNIAFPRFFAADSQYTVLNKLELFQRIQK